MKKYYIICFSAICSTGYSTNLTQLERIDNYIKPNLLKEDILLEANDLSREGEIELNTLKFDQLEKGLNEAILRRDVQMIKLLLQQYEFQPNIDPILVLFAQAAISYAEKDYKLAIEKFRKILDIDSTFNPARIELAKSYFLAKQDKNAKEQFQKAKDAEGIPPEVVNLIDTYLDAIKQRNQWQFYFNGYYIRDKNVNNVSDNPKIENTGFIKNPNMLPQKAEGIAYQLGGEKDFNLFNSHYIHFSTHVEGKLYWNNREYDDIYHRSYFGYRYKNANKTLSLLPFYERRWYGNHRYQWGSGVRAEYQYWLSTNWQLSSSAEYNKQHYFVNKTQNGYSTLFSNTVFWQKDPKQFVYLGADLGYEKTAEKQYSSNTKGIRLGWGKEWQYNIATRINVSVSDRKYKDKVVLGGILPLGKTRQDKIYSANMTVWKRDWNFWRIIPKLHLSWKKQKSSIPSMYSYTDKEVRLMFERNF